MPKKTEQQELRWNNPKGLGILYVRVMGSNRGWLWTSLAKKRKPTSIPWPPYDGTRRDELGLSREQRIAYNEGMKILQHRAGAHLLGIPDPTSPTSPTTPTIENDGEGDANRPRTLYQAIEYFKDQQFKLFTPATRARYRTAFRHFLADRKHGDIAFLYRPLYNRVATMYASCPLALVSQQKALYKLKEFFNFFVSMGFLDKSPMDLIKIPSHSDLNEEEAEPLSFDLLQRIATWMVTEELRRNALHISFMLLTGTRLAESLKCRADDIMYHKGILSLRIYGKVVKGKKREFAADGLRSGAVRFIPLRDAQGRETIPGLSMLLDQLIEYAKAQDGWLFPWRSNASVQKVWKRCRQSLKFDGKLKQIRATAGYMYREYLKWDVELRAEVLGHSVAVHVKHYNRSRERHPDELARAMTFAQTMAFFGTLKSQQRAIGR